MTPALRPILAISALPVAAFFAFVGWFKTFAPLATLAEHHAWTAVMPTWLGRAVGVSELIAAAALVLGIWPHRERVAAAAGLYLIANQASAAIVHLNHGETGALPQNAALAALAALAVTTAQTIQRKRIVRP